ncbi:unnamed protein product [Ambrosiozyma monospora]|uniref:Unnamed protein product n=1 Tax=Ambrosiozyma monospora TaxID=43982 RepID=A0ACB5TYB7_AMBMO|nr:unnamed protein product [Ambrosiozyma monospora]
MYDLNHYKWPSDKLLGETTINIGLFEGGRAANVVSPTANLTALLRTAVNAETIDKIVKGIIEKYEKTTECKFEFNLMQGSDPTFLDYKLKGFDTFIAKYSTDIPNMENRGFKRYLYGPGSIHSAHSDHEYVTSKSLLDSVEDLKKLIKYAL